MFEYQLDQLYASREECVCSNIEREEKKIHIIHFFFFFFFQIITYILHCYIHQCQQQNSHFRV